MKGITRVKVALVLGPTLFILMRILFHPEGLTPEANAVLATTIWMAVWWISEAVPISVTALLPIVLFPITGGLSLSDTTAQFGHKYVFLYLGGFVIAIAIERWGLHRRIALNIIKWIGTDVRMIILGFMIATAFLSMWISNTATAVMMLPIAVAIVKQLEDNPNTIANENLLFGKSLMLAVAYSASIGGIATLIGTPPNLVLAGIVNELYDVEITFAQWIKLGLPLSILMLIGCWFYLTRFAFNFEQKEFPGGKKEIARLLTQIGKICYEEKAVLIIFVVTAMAWMGRSILQTWIPAIDDTIIAMTSAIILFIIPTQDGTRKIINWEEAVQMPWGIILLFGGGMALAEGFESSGLAEYLASYMSRLDGLSLLLIIGVVVMIVNFLTEVTSNLATTAMILPILASMAVTLGVNPYYLLVSATLAASCAFMLPVATPPNAVVFGAGYLSISDMVKTGIFLNVFSIILITLLIYFILPYLWGF